MSGGTLIERSKSEINSHRSRSPCRVTPPALRKNQPKSHQSPDGNAEIRSSQMIRSCSVREGRRAWMEYLKQAGYNLQHVSCKESEKRNLDEKMRGEHDSEMTPKKRSCLSLNFPMTDLDGRDTTSGKSTLEILESAGYAISTPILTNVLTKSGMAIIKTDKVAIKQCRILVREARENKMGESFSHLTCAATEPFSLSVKNSRDEFTQYDVIFRVFFDGCNVDVAGKFLSVFVEISNPEGKTLETPFVVTFFLRNLKDENGKSFKKSIKMVPSPERSWVKRGIRDFVSVEDFNRLLEKESVFSFGIHIRQ